MARSRRSTSRRAWDSWARLAGRARVDSTRWAISAESVPTVGPTPRRSAPRATGRASSAAPTRLVDARPFAGRPGVGLGFLPGGPAGIAVSPAFELQGFVVTLPEPSPTSGVGTIVTSRLPPARKRGPSISIQPSCCSSSRRAHRSVRRPTDEGARRSAGARARSRSDRPRRRGRRAAGCSRARWAGPSPRSTRTRAARRAGRQRGRTSRASPAASR